MFYLLVIYQICQHLSFILKCWDILLALLHFNLKELLDIILLLLHLIKKIFKVIVSNKEITRITNNMEIWLSFSKLFLLITTVLAKRPIASSAMMLCRGSIYCLKFFATSLTFLGILEVLSIYFYSIRKSFKAFLFFPDSWSIVHKRAFSGFHD